MKTCCICGQPFEGYGNNPAPVKTRGKCCDVCNIEIVIPTRLIKAKDAQIQALDGKSVIVEFNNGAVLAGFLHKHKYTPRGFMPQYWLVTPLRTLSFNASDIKNIREG